MIRSELNTGPRRGLGRRNLNREHSPLLAAIVLYGSIVLASWLPTYAVAISMPIMPPFGYLLLVCWRLMRPGTLAPWAALPLGAFDDLVSGQPFGSAILLWSLTLLVFEWFESRFPWRGFLQDWLTSAVACGSYVILAAVVSGADLNWPLLLAIFPQLLLSMALYPIIAAMVATLDRFRLMRIKEIR